MWACYVGLVVGGDGLRTCKGMSKHGKLEQEGDRGQWMQGMEIGLDIHVLVWLVGAWSVCVETGTLGENVDNHG